MGGVVPSLLQRQAQPGRQAIPQTTPRTQQHARKPGRQPRPAHQPPPAHLLGGQEEDGQLCELVHAGLSVPPVAHKKVEGPAEQAGRKAGRPGRKWLQERHYSGFTAWRSTALHQNSPTLAPPTAAAAPPNRPQPRPPAGAHQQPQEGQHVGHQVHHPAESVLQDQA